MSELNKNSQALISVIIPVYNTAKYLEKCVDSLINQTYTNLEIILVDDGSTDNSPEICDRYASADSRVVVIHQENGGLSEARNTGLERAQGSFIGFVDSDDWVDLRLYETVMHEIKRNHCDVALIDLYKVEGSEITENKLGSFPAVYTKDEIMPLILTDRIGSQVWKYICKADFWQNIRFPCKINYEDIPTTYKVINQCNKTAYVNQCLYYYLMRNSGISWSFKPRNNFDIYTGFKERLEFVEQCYPQIVEECRAISLDTALGAYNAYLSPQNNHSISPQESAKILLHIRNNVSHILKNRFLKRERKAMLFLLAYSRPLYCLFYSMMKKAV